MAGPSRPNPLGESDIDRLLDFDDSDVDSESDDIDYAENEFFDQNEDEEDDINMQAGGDHGNNIFRIPNTTQKQISKVILSFKLL